MLLYVTQTAHIKRGKKTNKKKKEKKRMTISISSTTIKQDEKKNCFLKNKCVSIMCVCASKLEKKTKKHEMMCVCTHKNMIDGRD